MQVSFTAAALSDLGNIRKYIAADNPAALHRMAVTIVAAVDRLRENPRPGRTGAMAGTFELVVSPYVLVYEIHRAELVILRIWHGRQQRPGT